MLSKVAEIDRRRRRAQFADDFVLATALADALGGEFHVALFDPRSARGGVPAHGARIIPALGIPRSEAALGGVFPFSIRAAVTLAGKSKEPLVALARGAIVEPRTLDGFRARRLVLLGFLFFLRRFGIVRRFFRGLRALAALRLQLPHEISAGREACGVWVRGDSRRDGRRGAD